MSQSKASAAPDPEEIAGRYQVVKKLGAGAFGTVYKAKDKVLGRMLAIKTIRLEGLAASGASIEELMDRFRREAQISAQLRHPNIVTIYDVGEADGTSYLAMEFIDGVGLDRVIAAAGRLPLERAALIAAQVADALDFAHRHSVVHRDIKPANIMIEAGDRVKVTDFGIAKVTDSGDHLTMTGSLLGTPSYMSPEQAKGGKLDGRSDLFAVGAILYEMLAGQKAFRGDSITGLIFKIITEEPQLITEVDPTLPQEIVQAVHRALAKAPEARYQTGRELAEALLAFTRTGSAPTLRQGEVDTLRGGGGAAASPTVSGQSATIAGTATQSRTPATEIARPGMTPPAPPRPVEPTYLVSSGAPQPPAVDPTYLVGGARLPAPPPPAPVPPPVAPPLAATPAPRPPAHAPAHAPTPPARTARVAEPAKSKTGLIVGLVGVAALLALVLGGGALWYFTRGGSSQETQTAGTTAGGTGDTAGGAAAGSTTGTATGTESAPPAGDTSAAAGADATTGASGSDATATGSGAAGGGTTEPAGGAVQPTGSTGGGSQPASGGAGSGRASAGQTGGGASGASSATATEPRVPSRPPAGDLAILDQEPPELTGREAGASVADTYRSNRGYGTSSGSFGASGRLRARPRVPRDLTMSEKRAAVVLLNLRGLQEVHKRRAGSYGTFLQVMPVAVGSPDRFDRAGYRFELKLEDDGFTIMATSMSGRALLVDDTGYVRYVED